MIRDRIMALLALVALTGFFGIVVVKLGRVDLMLAVLLGLGLVLYDLWLQLRPRRHQGR